jgi:ferredoxin
MAIPTSRTKEKASIHINIEKCTGCGRCVDVCSDNSLMLEKGKAVESNSPHFGCIGCGHCMAVCPEAAIEILGRTLSPDDLFDLPTGKAPQIIMRSSITAATAQKHTEV